jgi:hypothetical protein
MTEAKLDVNNLPADAAEAPVARPARRPRKPAASLLDTMTPPVAGEEAKTEAKPEAKPAKSDPNPAAAAEIEAVSHGPAAMAVAHAPHGSDENSDYAPLPATYPYRTRMRRAEYEAQKEKLQIELLKVQSWVRETGQKDRKSVV